MNATSWPVIQGKSGALKNTNLDIGSPKLSSGGGGSRSILCCSKIKFLTGLLWLSYIVHLLVVALAVSMLYNYPGNVSRGSSYGSNETGTELLIVGIAGIMVNLLALIGIWKGQRLFLTPAMLYMAITLLLDLVTTIKFFAGQFSSGDDVFDHYDDLETIEVDSVGITRLIGPAKHAREHSSAALFPLFLVKMVICVTIFRTLCDVYKKDLTMRSTRSPIRNKGKCVLEWPEGGRMVVGKFSPPPQGCQQEQESSQPSNLTYSRIH